MQIKQRLCLIVLLVFFNSYVQAEAESPEIIVKHTVDEVLDVLQQQELSETEKKQKVFEIAKQRINFLEMGRRVLATNWNKADTEQRDLFVSKFEIILLNSYWTRIKRYTGEHVEYIAASYDSDDLATVDTVIVSDGNVQIPISYRMKRFVEIWYAYDFIVERLSLVQSYRNEYQAIVKNLGIDGLLQHMQREIDSYQ